jgi:hypothetical protein
MRAVLLILILVIVVAIAAIATGFVDITQTRGAKVPNVGASQNGVAASGGQTPAFDVETGSVEVGTKQATVPVPTLEVTPAGNAAQSAPTNTATTNATP